MPPSQPPGRLGSAAFQLETDRGVRHLEFDPDVFRRRDVRILVDGKRVASLSFPKPASPYQEVAFELDGYDLIGVTWLPTESWPEGLPLRYDLIANGRSLSDGSSHDEVRQGAPAPGAPYPRSFYYLDITVRIAPAAALPGLAVGIGRSADQLGWQRAFGLVALILIGVALASQLGSRAWQRIRTDEARSVRSRVALGWAALGACYTVAVAVAIALLAAARS